MYTHIHTHTQARLASAGFAKGCSDKGNKASNTSAHEHTRTWVGSPFLVDGWREVRLVLAALAQNGHVVSTRRVLLCMARRIMSTMLCCNTACSTLTQVAMPLAQAHCMYKQALRLRSAAYMCLHALSPMQGMPWDMSVPVFRSVPLSCVSLSPAAERAKGPSTRPTQHHDTCWSPVEHTHTHTYTHTNKQNLCCWRSNTLAGSSKAALSIACC